MMEYPASRLPVRRNFFQRWDEPAEFEPAHAYFSRMAGRNLQTSARVFAEEMGLDGRHLPTADCLDAVRHLPLKGMDGLVAATPIVTPWTVHFLGQTFRRRHWSGEEPRWCPGCIAESAHYRVYHGLIDFTVCPIHGCPIEVGTGGENSLSWRHPTMAHTPDGTPVGRPSRRHAEPLESFERWLLGQLGVLPTFTVRILKGVSPAKAIDTVSLLGRAAACGWSRTAPRIGQDGLTRQSVVAAGFAVLTGGTAAIEALFERLAAEATGRTGPGHRRWGLNHSYGWLFQAVLYGHRSSTVIGAVKSAAMTVAMRRGVFARSTTATDAVTLEPNFLHRDETALLAGLQPRLVDKIAARNGIYPNVQAGRFVMYARHDAVRLQREIEKSLPRQAAIASLGLKRAEFDAIEAWGSLRPLCRLGGGTRSHDRFRPVELEALIPMTPNLAVAKGPILTCAAFATATGLTVTEVILAIVRRMIVPIARDTTSPGFLGLRLDPRDVPRFAEIEIRVLRRGGRERKPSKAQGLPNCDAATILGVGIITIQSMVQQGILRVLPGAVGSRPRIDAASLEAFRTTYATAAEYASVLECPKSDAMRRLQRLGIAIHVRPLGERSSVSAFVERRAVMDALGFDIDPLAQDDAGWKGFWRNFSEDLTRRKSIFRLATLSDGPEARLMSGDRRTSCTIRVQVKAQSQHDQHPPADGDVLPNRASWKELYPRIEALAYKQRAGATDISADICHVKKQNIELLLVSSKHRAQKRYD